MTDALSRRGYSGFQRIDSGGQANVYKSVKNGRDYAIKVVHIEDPNSQKLDDDLKRELQIVNNLKHPNCIHIEELFRTRTKIYIIMDFAPNGNIGNVIRKNGPLCEWNAKAWFCPVGRALRYLHEHKIAHRDIKLDNVLLDAYLNPILTDFGFSRFVAVDPATGKAVLSDTYCGTTSFSAPEVLKHTPYDPFSADIWSMGILLFIMLNQTYPFDRHDKEAMISKQLQKQYAFQEDIKGRLTTEAKELVALMLEPNPPKRPSIVTLCQHGWFPVVLSEADQPRGGN